MNLAIPGNYLAFALLDRCDLAGMSLSQHRIADLILLTGQLVACDPLVAPERQPFTLRLPCGAFPVTLSVAQVGTDQRVAFASVRFSPADPTRWELLTLNGQDPATLKPDEIFGYPVDAGTGCFMDASTGAKLVERMEEQEDYFEDLIAEMQKTYVHTWSWLDARFGEGNMVAFSTGYGDGLYASYAGRDQNGEVAVVVTDFGVATLPTEPT